MRLPVLDIQHAPSKFARAEDRRRYSRKAERQGFGDHERRGATVQ